MQIMTLVGGLSAGAMVLANTDEITKVAEDALGNVVKDLQVDAIQVTSARGHMQAGSLDRLVLTLETGGASQAVWMNGTIVRLQGDEADVSADLGDPGSPATVRVLRDRDASMKEHLLNSGDLVELTLDLPGEGPRFSGTENLLVTFLPNDESVVEVRLKAPQHGAGSRLVEYDVDQRL